LTVEKGGNEETGKCEYKTIFSCGGAEGFVRNDEMSGKPDDGGPRQRRRLSTRIRDSGVGNRPNANDQATKKYHS
jgi:hypothetical protein